MTRLSQAALTLTLVCVVVLLASACGWGGGNYARSPVVQPQEFVLWQTAPGDPPRIVGAGTISGSLASITGYLHLFQVPCLRNRNLFFESTALGTPPRFAPLSSTPGQPVAISLDGRLRSLPHGEWIVDLPFSGTITPVAPCTGAEFLHVEARPGPELRHSWYATHADKNATLTVNRLMLSQARPEGRSAGALWGDISLAHSTCGGIGSFFQPLDSVPPPDATRTFLMRDNSTLTLSGLPSTLDPDPPNDLDLTLTFHGGPCDARTFHLALSGGK